MENNKKLMYERFENNQCIEDVLNMLNDKKSVNDIFAIDGNLVIVFDEELQTSEVDDIQSVLKKVKGCGKVFSDEFELGYQGDYKSILLKLFVDNISVADFSKSEFVSMYNKPIGETIFYVYDIDDEYLEEEEDDIFDIENWEVYEFKNIHDAIAKHEDSNLQDLEPIRYTTWFDTNEPPFVYEWGVVTSDGKMKAQTREGRDLPTYAHGGKIDMRELEYTLKRIKQENPSKKVGYSFIADAPKGYRISINGKYRDEQGNYHAQGGEMEDYYDGQGDEGYGNTFEELRSQIVLGVMEDLRIPRETAEKVVWDKEEMLKDLIENHGQTNIYSLVQKAQEGDDSYAKHIETRRRMRNDENTYPKGFNQFEKGGITDDLTNYIDWNRSKGGEYEKVTNMKTLNALKENGFIEFTEETGKDRMSRGSMDKVNWPEPPHKIQPRNIKSAISPIFRFRGKEYFIGYDKGINFLNLYVLKKGERWDMYHSEENMAKGREMAKGSTHSIDLDTNNIEDEDFQKYLKSNSISYKVISRAKGTSYSQDNSIKYVGKKEALMSMIDDYFAGTQQDSIEAYKEIKKMATGGEVKKISTTTQVKRNLRGSGAFTLELEMAVYVPSTTVADQIISKTLFQKRIQEVEKYLSKLFGGYSSNAVEGGYVSQEKGLIKEDVAKVTAFGTEDAIKKNFKPLMRQISKWCEAWGQESMGFEFEGDLYYVSKDAKFSKGGKIENKPVKPKFVKNAKK